MAAGVHIWHALVDLYIEVTFDSDSSAAGPPTKQTYVQAVECPYRRTPQYSLGRFNYPVQSAGEQHSSRHCSEFLGRIVLNYGSMPSQEPSSTALLFGVAAFISRSSFFRCRGAHKSHAVRPSVCCFLFTDRARNAADNLGRNARASLKIRQSG